MKDTPGYVLRPAIERPLEIFPTNGVRSRDSFRDQIETEEVMKFWGRGWTWFMEVSFKFYHSHDKIVKQLACAENQRQWIPIHRFRKLQSMLAILSIFVYFLRGYDFKVCK